MLVGCGSDTASKTDASADAPAEAATVDEAKTEGVDYMALVNKTHALPEDWEEELEAAVIRIKCKFAFWDGCELYSIRHAGDDAVTEEKLAQLNEKASGANHTRVVEFLMDFRTGEKKATPPLSQIVSIRIISGIWL